MSKESIAIGLAAIAVVAIIATAVIMLWPSDITYGEMTCYAPDTYPCVRDLHTKDGWECWQEQQAAGKPWQTIECTRVVLHDNGWQCFEQRNELDSEPYTTYCLRSFRLDSGGECVWVKPDIDAEATLTDRSVSLCKHFNPY